jgi:8-oxo-dGTP pyrophosphatase MutT (NUDIX family)
MRGVDGQNVRDAATVAVLRARMSAAGVAVLMLRRHAASGFVPGAWVFPGGVVDDADRTLTRDRWNGIDPQALSDRFRLPADRVLGMHVAAVRETFEEAGLLLATRASGEPVDLSEPGVEAMRRALVTGAATAADFARWLGEAGLVLDLAALTYWSRWLTPTSVPRRYDTCFFVAQALRGQVANHDGIETTAQRWITPHDALASMDMHVVFPTRVTLTELARFRDIESLVAYGRARPEVRSIEPHLEWDADGGIANVSLPDDDAHP